MGMLAMGSIEEALKTAGADDDVHTILRVLGDKPVGFKCHEPAAGPLANMNTTMLTGLNIRMLSAIKRYSSSSNINVGPSAVIPRHTVNTDMYMPRIYPSPSI